MSSYDRKGFFEKIGAFIPGYKGYSEKEMRRDTDSILRGAIVTRLTEKKVLVDDLIKDFSKKAQFDLLEDLESLKRRIDGVADKVRHAPAGYSGFFDTVQIKNEDLDKLYRHDLGLKDAVEEFTKGLADLPSAADKAAGLKALLSALQELDEVVRRRDEAITEVA